jgi:hypothetical protein
MQALALAPLAAPARQKLLGSLERSLETYSTRELAQRARDFRRELLSR